MEPFSDEEIKTAVNALAGAGLTAGLDIGYEIGYEFGGFPDIGTFGKGSGGLRLPNLDDVVIDLGTPSILGLAAFLTGDKDLFEAAVGSAAYGLPMFFFNMWRMTAAEMKAGPGVLKKVETEGVERSTESHRIIRL